VGAPWLVGVLSPTDLAGGFKALNITAAAVACVLFALWLETAGIADRRLRLLLVTLFMAAWHGPVRFVYFAPTLVDPPLFACLLGGCLLIARLRNRFGWATLTALAAVCFIGALVRESMILVPAAFLFVNNPLPPNRGRGGVPRSALPIPAAAAAAALAITRAVAHATPGAYSFADAAGKMIATKPLFTLPLAAFITFGPVLAIVIRGWRGAWRDLTGDQYLGAFLAGAVALAYVGGSDTERLLFWSAPAVYVLLGRAIARQRADLASPPLVAVWATLQALSCRLFWPVPDPDAIRPDWRAAHGLAGKAYALVNQVFGLDAFYLNLWSYFAESRVRLLQLAIYAGCSVALLLWMRDSARGTVHGLAHGGSRGAHAPAGRAE
jgi:hypothetical protein